MRSRVFLAFLAAVALVACSTTETEGLWLDKVVPARVAPGMPTAVQIMGRGFQPCIRVDYDDEQRSEVSLAFQATLRGGHPLSAVTWKSTLLLTATVPAGLTPGRYTLTVTGPCGHDGSLADGLEVMGSVGDGGVDGTPGDGFPETRVGDMPYGIGAPCSNDSQCLSNHCVHGVCCDSACLAICRACDVAGSVGTCSPVPAGADPHSHCSAESPLSCGRDGTCDGHGACRLYAESTPCSSGRCVSQKVLGGIRLCDGKGICQRETQLDCFPFKCDTFTNACHKTCSPSNQDTTCQGYYACDPSTNTCFSSCTQSTQCKSGGQCVGGKCIAI
jgi:hypothetical protein